MPPCPPPRQPIYFVSQRGSPVVALPVRGAEMKLIALIDDYEVIEKILRHLELWPEQGGVASPSRAPPRPDDGERIVELCFDDPFPDYDTEPVMAYANDPDFAA